MSQSVVKFVKPTQKLLQHIIDNMRVDDINEVMASSGSSPSQAILSSVKNSEYVTVVVIGDEPCLVFGIVNRDVLIGSGTPWALGTDGVMNNARLFIKNSKKVLHEVMSRYQYLSNSVHADNMFSIRWLKWMGFTVDPAQPVGINGTMFHRFYLER